MAEKKESKIILEREYNIPLRRRFRIVQRYLRANKAMKGVREFLQKHMKSETVLIGKHLNQAIWKNGIQYPPHHVSVIAKKNEEGVVYAEIKGAPVEKVAEEKKPAKQEKKDAPKAESKPEVKEAEIVEEKKALKSEPAKPAEASKPAKAATKPRAPKKPAENKE